MFNSLQRDHIALLRQFADAFRGNALSMWILRRRMALEPGDHRRPGRERLPAAVEAARTLRSRRVDYVMSHLWVCPVDPTVKRSIENNSAANAGADGHIDQAGAIPPRTPAGFGESGSVAIVLQ